MTTDPAPNAESDAGPCECGRGPVAVCAFQRNTSLLIRRIGDMGHERAADRRCIDCVADMAAEVAASPTRPFHPDFSGGDCECAMTEASQRHCPIHGERANES